METNKELRERVKRIREEKSGIIQEMIELVKTFREEALVSS